MKIDRYDFPDGVFGTILFLAVVVFVIAFALAAVVGVFLFAAWLLMVGWNFCVPAMFHGPRIGMWLAVGVLVLLLLVGGIVRPKVRPLQGEARADDAEQEVARLRRALEAIECSADPAGRARKELKDSEKRYRK